MPSCEETFLKCFLKIDYSIAVADKKEIAKSNKNQEHSRLQAYNSHRVWMNKWMN